MRDAGGLGAPSFRIGGVLHVGPGEDRAGPGPERRADVKLRIGRMGARANFACPLEQLAIHPAASLLPVFPPFSTFSDGRHLCDFFPFGEKNPHENCPGSCKSVGTVAWRNQGRLRGVRAPAGEPRRYGNQAAPGSSGDTQSRRMEGDLLKRVTSAALAAVIAAAALMPSGLRIAPARA